MRPTLRSILTSPALRAGRPEVLSGSDRLDTPVRWVHVSEVRELAGLLQGGELILSTGLPLGSPTDGVAYLKDLVTAGAVGLVVELGPAFPAVAPPLIEYALSVDFPLVALHAQVRFVEVTEEVHRGIVADQFEEVEFARQVHETFTRLSLDNAAAPQIVTTAADLCGSSVLLEDLNRHVVAFEARGRPASGLLADWEPRSRLTPVLADTGLTGTEGWLTTPVGNSAAPWGRLVLPNPQASQAKLAMVLERAAQALELGRMVERDRLSLELRAQGSLLADLAEGRLTDDASAAARATALGLPPATRYVAVVAHPTTAAHDLVERVSAAVQRTGLRALTGALPRDRVGLLLAVPRTGRRAPDEAPLLDAFADALGPGQTLGVAAPGNSLRAAGVSLRLAAHVAEVAAAMPGEPRPWFRHSEVRIYGLLGLLQGDPRLQAYVEAELGPLLEHEARHSDGMLDLLRTYVASGGNKTRLAEASHRSRPAVYKRLARLSRILDADLDDPISLLSLGVAVLALDSTHPEPRSIGP